MNDSCHAGLRLNDQTRAEVRTRMRSIKGHLDGVARMLDEDSTYCVDVLKQTYAIRRAIEKLETNLLEGHLHTCVIDGVKQGREQQVLDELVELYSLAEK